MNMFNQMSLTLNTNPWFGPGLKNLESLNLDSCGIGDEGLVNLAGDLWSAFYLTGVVTFSKYYSIFYFFLRNFLALGTGQLL